MYKPNGENGQLSSMQIQTQILENFLQLYQQGILNNRFLGSPRETNNRMPQQGSQECNYNNTYNYFQFLQQNQHIPNLLGYAQLSPPYTPPNSAEYAPSTSSPALSQSSSVLNGDNNRSSNFTQGPSNSDSELDRTSNSTARPCSSSSLQWDNTMQTQQHGNNGNQPSLSDTENNAATKVAERKENRQNKGYKKRLNLAEQCISNATGESGAHDQQYINYLTRPNEVAGHKIMHKEQRQQRQQQRSRRRQADKQQLPQSSQETCADTCGDQNVMDENSSSSTNDMPPDSIYYESSDDSGETEGGGTTPVRKIDENLYKTEPGWSVPRYNKKNDAYMIKCNYCKARFDTKVKLWNHLEVTHFGNKKVIRCLMGYCAFVTAVKHHLAYHMCLHTGERPFACDQCKYRCINNAMLKSHMKSHSTVYEFHCADCPTRSKFHHAIKQHLEDTGHKQGATYDENGNPCNRLIDVHGKRRGPRKTTKKNSNGPLQSVAVAPIAPTTQGDPQPSGSLNLPLLQPEEIAFLHAHYQSPLVANYQTAPNSNTISSQVQDENDAPLDLSKSSSNTTTINLSTTTVQIVTAQIESSPKVSGASRRKGKAIKCVRDEVEDGQELSSITAIKEEPVDAADEEPEAETANYYCQHCKVGFGFHDLYQDHMRYHTIDDPSKCNLCQKRYEDALSFYRHIGVEPHNL